MRTLSTCLVLVVGWMAMPPAWGEMSSLASPGTLHQQSAPLQDDGRGTKYKFASKDNICGVKVPVAISKPARVRYEDLVEATVEWKKIQKEQIDPQSSKGIALMTKARDKVRLACERVKNSRGFCGIWKNISRRDGTPIPDVTAQVVAVMSS